jgi:N-acetylglucosaminyldiphosphoundecaprenol N-acetyl-beta-D-mannosaminyltransferase
MVAFGNPKQEKWIAMHRNRLKVPVCIGVGGSFDFLSGRVRRAPAWMQRSGLEWFYRTVQEPSRLAKRYFNNATGLIRYLPAQLLWMAAQSKRGTQGRIATEVIGKTKVHRIVGDLTGPVLIQLELTVQNTVLSGSHVVLDLSSTTYIGADALGSLIHVINLARRWRRELWLAGLSPNLARVLHAAQIRTSFRVAGKVAEALRRIDGDLVPIPQFAEDSAFFLIGGQFVPVYTQEMPELYRQVQELMEQQLTMAPVEAPAQRSSIPAMLPG